MKSRSSRVRGRFWQRTSLQTRITVLTTLLIAGGLVLSGIGTHFMLRGYLYDQVDQQLMATASTVGRMDVTELQTVSRLLPTEYYAVYFASDGSTLAIKPANVDASILLSTDALLEDLTSNPINEAYTVDLEDAPSWRFVNVASSSNSGLIVGVPLSSAEQTLSQYTNIFVGFGFIVLFAAGVSAWFLAGSLFAPLRRAEDAAATIAAGDYTKRLTDDTPVTEIGRLNHSLNVMTDRIEAAFDQRAHTIDQMRRFVSDASHELRTPLVSVRGYAELYRMGALTEEKDVRQAMERIEREAIRMSRLVEDLLALARLDEARPLVTGRIDLSALVHDAAMDAIAREHDRPVEVAEWHPTSDDGSRSLEEADQDATRAAAPVPAPPVTSPIRRWSRRPKTSEATVSSEPEASSAPKMVRPSAPIVIGDEDKLRQLLTNLVTNALRYTPEASPLELAVGVDPTRLEAVVEVRDHGPGIPEQLRTKIFQRFFRADNSRARDTGGSGLGLAIVAAIVQAHRGSVEAVETPGGGATFVVRLPLAPVEVEESSTTPPPQAARD